MKIQLIKIKKFNLFKNINILKYVFKLTSNNIDFNEPFSPNGQNLILNGSIHSSSPSYYYGMNGSSDNTDVNNITTNGGSIGTPRQLQHPKLEFNSIEEKDAFLIFRALCKLSMKHLPDDQDPRYI
jgi:hypothetical protein